MDIDDQQEPTPRVSTKGFGPRESSGWWRAESCSAEEYATRCMTRRVSTTPNPKYERWADSTAANISKVETGGRSTRDPELDAYAGPSEG
jgi:hypothetical protein